MVEKTMDLQITISADNDIPAFAGYVNHSGPEGSPEIVVNFRASLFLCADHDDVSYKEMFAENVVHEMLHMVQDIFDQAFDEDEVENAIMAAKEHLKQDQAWRKKMEEKFIVEKTNELLWFVKGWLAYQDNFGCIGQNYSETEGKLSDTHTNALEKAIEMIKSGMDKKTVPYEAKDEAIKE